MKKRSASTAVATAAASGTEGGGGGSSARKKVKESAEAAAGGATGVVEQEVQEDLRLDQQQAELRPPSRWYKETERLAQRLRLPGTTEDDDVDEDGEGYGYGRQAMGAPRNELALLRVLRVYKDYLVEKTAHHLGYPYNLHFKWDHDELSEFLRFSINNLGDPFVESNYGVHSRHFELEVLEFFAAMWKLPIAEMWGYVTTCGTEGNLHGILVGRETLPTGILYYSRESHYCVAKAGRFYRMPMVEVRSDYTGAIDLEDFEAKLAENKHLPAIVNVNCGTTVKGALDDIDGVLAALARQGFTEDRFYIHVDGALMGICTPFLRNAPQYTFEKPIGSFSCSGHKFVGCPMPSGVILVRKKYIGNLSSDIEYLNSKDTTIMGSRNGQAPLFLWYHLMKKGFAGLEADVRYSISIAKNLKGLLTDAGISCMLLPNSVTVCFQRPQDSAFVRKWQLACEGDIAHALCMPSTKESKIAEFVAELTHLFSSGVAKYLGCYKAQLGPNCRCAECAMARRFQAPDSLKLMPLNSPFANITVEFANREDVVQGAIKLARSLLGWKIEKESDMRVTVVTGGITNQMLLLSHHTAPATRPVLMRLYGKNTEEFINRNKENRLMEYLQRSIGNPGLVGRFTNGRLEEFLEVETLTEKTMRLPTHVPQIARALVRLHMSKPGLPFVEGEAVGFKSLMALYELVANEHATTPFTGFKYPLSRLFRQIQLCKEFLATVPSPVVFAHNDLLSGNILCKRDGTHVFCDWEYADYNYRGWDLGNHLCEYAGLTNNPDSYPTREERLFFLSEYLKAAKEYAGSDMALISNTTTTTTTTTTTANGIGGAGDTNSASNRSAASAGSAGGGGGAGSATMAVTSIADTTVEDLLREAEAYAMPATLMWGLWGMAQSRYSENDFDYIAFATTKLDLYFHLVAVNGIVDRNRTPNSAAGSAGAVFPPHREPTPPRSPIKDTKSTSLA